MNAWCRDLAKSCASHKLGQELADALLHGDGVAHDRALEEVEVESVAYVVLNALGLDAGDYSFAYVTRWSGGSVELLKDTAGCVIDTPRGS
jgi:hypothetical protein